MKRRLTILLAYAILATVLSPSLRAQEFGFAVYNADRLYDTLPSPFYDDSDYTPRGRLEWTSARYERKVRQTAALLDSMAMPVVALRGVENENVVRDIAGRCRCDYSYIHRTADSFDGMDFALLYFGDAFIPSKVSGGALSLTVEGEMYGRACAFIICRRARNTDDEILRLRRANPEVAIIVAGDLRDVLFEEAGCVDITENIGREGRGNALYADGWKMSDKIAVCGAEALKSYVYLRPWLLDRRGAPAATYEGRIYRGGAGRRLPVCAVLRLGGGGKAEIE